MPEDKEFSMIRYFSNMFEPIMIILVERPESLECLKFIQGYSQFNYLIPIIQPGKVPLIIMLFAFMLITGVSIKMFHHFH